MRRTHRKSRYGCRVCKQRHIKCDESRPSCLNCLAVERRCPFLDGASALLPSTTSSHQSPHHSVPSSPSPTHNYEPVSEPTALGGQDYTINHFELFHHFEHHLAHNIEPTKPGTDSMMERAVQESFNFPFLMDELLALSAAHKSTLNPEHRESYLAEAAHLQTRGLSRFNSAQPELSDANCVPVLLYSIILGQHVLFDTFSLRSDYEAVMGKLVQCFSLHNGIRTIASTSKAKILRELLGGDTSYLVPAEPVKPRDECGPIVTLLDECRLDDEAKGHCRDATKALQLLFSRRRLGSLRGALATQEWAVRVPKGYIALLNQRLPEAMVILAYYAVLLHYSRSSWAIRDTGAYLVRSITSHLREDWAPWLTWPNQVLEEDSTLESAADDNIVFQ